MKRVNLDPNEPFVGNRPAQRKGPSLIRKTQERKPMIDLDAMDAAAEEELRRKAALEAKERSRAEHQATQAVVAAATPVSAQAPLKAKPRTKRKKT